MTFFTSKPVVQLPANERARIECIVAYGDKLLLGLSSGTLYVYTINDPHSPNLQAHLFAIYKDFATRSIERIGIVKDAGVLVVLGDNIVSVYDVETFTLDEQLSKTKGATTFSINSGVKTNENDEQSVISRLVVGCKRRLVCYEWRDSEFAEYKEIQLPDRARTLTFFGTDKVIVGMNSDSCLVDISTSIISNILVPATHSSSSFASVGISYIGIGSRQPPPLAVNLANDTIFYIKDGQSQFIDYDGQILDKPQISWPSVPDLVGYSYPYLICIFSNKSIEIRNPDTTTLLQTMPLAGIKSLNDGKLFYVASSNGIFRLLPTDYKQQVLSLAKTDLDEAISVLNQIEPVLIDDKHKLLRDLQILKATEMFHHKQFDESMLLFADISAPPDLVIALYPHEISGRKEIEEPRIEEQDILTTHDEANEIGEGTSVTAPNLDRENSKAIRALMIYLADTRRKLSGILETDSDRIPLTELYGDLEKAATMVDTALFKCYLIKSPALVGPLVRIHNHCDPDVVTEMLSKARKWRELIDFFYGKGLHRMALEMLKKLSDSKDSSLQGPEPTVKYIQRLNDDNIDLIFEFATWPITVSESYGMEIFVEESNESESLPPGKVLKYLEPLSINLAISYLDHLIHAHDDETPQFHTTLAVLYVEKILKSNDTTLTAKLVEFLKSSRFYRPERVLAAVPKHDVLLEVKAILYGRRGEHKKALELYVFNMKDFIKARLYCSNLYDSDKSLGLKALHILLHLYIDPPQGQEKHISEALQLLSSQGSRMSVTEVINTLPDNITVSDIRVFLQSQVRVLTEDWNKGLVDSNLRKVHLVKTQETLLDLQQKSTIITSFKTCKRCMKRLGHSVISVFPNGTVVHYGCARAYKESLDKQNKGPLSIEQFERRREEMK